MQLVEQHCTAKHDPRYRMIDEAAFKSKNLYNAALYEIRQAFTGYMSAPILMESREEREERYKYVAILPEEARPTRIAL